MYYVSIFNTKFCSTKFCIFSILNSGNSIFLMLKSVIIFFSDSIKCPNWHFFQSIIMNSVKDNNETFSIPSSHFQTSKHFWKCRKQFKSSLQFQRGFVMLARASNKAFADRDIKTAKKIFINQKFR